MRIAYITAGAAGMYCGSCMHDNTLARTLIDRGHDVALMPAYTPLRTDEESVTVGKVFYGAINIYLETRYPFYRRAPKALRWLLDRPPLLRLVSRLGSSTDASELGDLTLATLDGEQGPQQQELEQLVQWLQQHHPADVVHLSHTLFLGFARRIREVLGVPVVSSLQGEDLFVETLKEPHRSRIVGRMRERAQEIDAFTAPCRDHAERMGELLALPQDRIHIVPFGIRTEDFRPAQGNPPDQPVIGYLARQCPEKGLHLVVEAFLRLAQQPGREQLRLRVAGYVGDRDRSYLQEQQRRVEAAGLADRVQWQGEIDRQGKVDFLAGLDLFTVPAVYREPKGLSVIEAQVAGVPAVLPRHGTFPEMLENTGGGVLVSPGSAEALAAGLAELLDDPERRRQMGQQARERASKIYSAEAMAEGTLAVYDSLLSDQQPAAPIAAQA